MAAFHCRDLDINPMTLKLEGYLYILKMYLYIENEVAGLWHLKNENNYQGQKSRSNVINFQTLLAFIVGHIPTKLHQFLISSFRDFVRTDTHRQTPPKTPARSMRAGHYLHTLI